MPITQQRMEQLVPSLTADVFGNGEFNIVFFPSRMSKPMIKRIQDMADDPDWEKKADSQSSFLLELIDSWDYAEADTIDPTKVLYLEGVLQVKPVTQENLSALGFAIQKQIGKAINKTYGEFMQEGEEPGASSGEQSPADKESTSNGIRLLPPQSDVIADLGN